MDRRRIFVDDEDYATYVRLLAKVVERQGWRLLCFCLMPNHVHLVIETPDTNLGNGMQWLHGRYARAFNERHGRVGHLFESRYKSPPILTGEDLVRTVAYVVMNPVKAVLCERAADWPWGSHALLSAPDGAPAWLAHPHLVDCLDEATGLRCYPELVASHERALASSRRSDTNREGTHQPPRVVVGRIDERRQRIAQPNAVRFDPRPTSGPRSGKPPPFGSGEEFADSG